MRLKYILSFLFIFNCFFPYIYLIPLQTDSQPIAFLFSIALFIFYYKKIDKDDFVLFILFVISFVFLLFSNFSFSSFRSFYSYASLFFITFISYKTLSYLNGIPYKLFVITVVIWGIVGFVQLFINPDFCTFLLRGKQGGFGLETGRGVTSLSTEPSYYGMMCLFFLIILCLNYPYKRKSNWLFFVIMIQLFIFSRSSIAILVLMISFIISAIYKGIKYNILHLFLLLILIPIFCYVIFSLSIYMPNYRIGSIILDFMNHPFDLSAFDGSVQERFFHVYFSLYGTIQNCGLPHGFDNFHIVNQGNFYFLDDLEINYSRIMSAFGGILYELGFFSIMFFSVFLRSVKALIKNDINNLFYITILVVILFVGFSFSSSIIPFILGNIIFLKNRCDKSLIKLK
ncbi:hypothetical protein [Parabacteroides goldsteinii]|uniref:O-antigen polymerase n=1 Tax=Parabacteroides goldsteinii CL02T12C30 TaxID=999418 RepID=K6A967_9BACT|nr:hypothetical protein [Parabacteroides goldsteinii]EKN12228.1 hypothetical protein HMPREF1076_03393 [Parabacteroides goldsteinii CL02T12C30]